MKRPAVTVNGVRTVRAPSHRLDAVRFMAPAGWEGRRDALRRFRFRRRRSSAVNTASRRPALSCFFCFVFLLPFSFLSIFLAGFHFVLFLSFFRFFLTFRFLNNSVRLLLFGRSPMRFGRVSVAFIGSRRPFVAETLPHLTEFYRVFFLLNRVSSRFRHVVSKSPEMTWFQLGG